MAGSLFAAAADTADLAVASAASLWIGKKVQLNETCPQVLNLVAVKLHVTLGIV